MTVSGHLTPWSLLDHARNEIDQAHQALDEHHVPRRVGPDGPTATLAWRIQQIARRTTKETA